MTGEVIIRHKTRSDFTLLQNDILRDRRISWKALGLLAYLLYLPSDFKLNLRYLSTLRARAATSSRDATRAGVRELESAGYVRILRERDQHGRYTTVTWLVTDQPADTAQEPSPRTDFPEVDFPVAAGPIQEKPTLTNTSSDEELITTTTTTALDQTLVFPRLLPPLERAAIADDLAKIPNNHAQQLLDELADALDHGSTIKTSPVRWFRGLLRRYEKGEFRPTGGIRIAAQREAKRSKRDVDGTGERSEARSDAAVARAHLSTIQAHLRR
ncbi:hypothetical protein EVC45_43465 [Paraburkholderia sp. UYCP14C]|uniref:hypothetical protein n=1 Tax=Paraburkholderia sp. UYCP14C TaxID=2511130 RepID=UPI001020A0AC|nr:hypothetical protein [Paraburkholderia sp. UYCP14C]RZF23612.1 hypothetical protein EVC45_43465 [Paraburkholderia sp. UYCP14C]